MKGELIVLSIFHMLGLYIDDLIYFSNRQWEELFYPLSQLGNQLRG